MAQKKFKRVLRPATASEKKRHSAMRKQAVKKYPPAKSGRRGKSPPGIPQQIRRAREARGLTWYAVSKLAGIPNSNTVRDIEYGRDAQFSNLEAVAKVLGLRLELVEETS